ncbi:hypothetical protein [Nocardia sp. NRRL WC-3656]|uniref:hypothetical protein n=1 Tax=Nocardia sp. NRRL WC-3656 TaxID=1463824 RepID=UPI0012DD301F|nr:hypothetical protein [Nocardia sp. NRRL WC-3656]
MARMLADRHGVTVVGFDLPDLQEIPVREFVFAVDRVLTEYPAIDLDVVGVADLGDDSEEVRWHHGTVGAVAVRSITLGLRDACGATQIRETPKPAAGHNDSAIYWATVRELGLALDHIGGGVARKATQRTLIAEYLRGMAGRYTTLGELLRGYRRWRAEWAQAVGVTGDFNVGIAVGAAFADVVLHGEQASVAARALHSMLIDAVEPLE